MLVLVTDIYNNSVYININQVCAIRIVPQVKHNNKEHNCYLIELANDKLVYIPDREATHLIGVMHIR